MKVRRATSATPLARQYAAELAGRAQRPPPDIRWSAFRRREYPEPALELASQAALALAEGEYGAIDLFADLLSGLALVAAPFDFLQAAARVPADEARHAEYALHMAELCAGRPVEARFDRDGALARRKQAPSEIADVDRAMVLTCAIGETLAAALIGACHRRATDPVARSYHGALLRDEIHHARLGWYYLSWRSERWTRRERQVLSDAAARMLVGLEVAFCRGRDAPPGSRQAARALGVLDTPSQRRAIRDVVQNEIVPGLDALGLGASHAWRARRRAPPLHRSAS